MSSKIKIEIIDKDTVKVNIAPDTPMEMVEHLAKSLSSKGLTENAKRSTLCTRYFSRKQDKLTSMMDELLKSLQGMSGGSGTASKPAPSKPVEPLSDKSKEDMLAAQLYQLMSSKSMLPQPSTEDMIRAGKMMGLEASKQGDSSRDAEWNLSLSKWFEEVTKPISQRFSSEEEELKYWNSIKVSDHGSDDEYGY